MNLSYLITAESEELYNNISMFLLVTWAYLIRFIQVLHFPFILQVWSIVSCLSKGEELGLTAGALKRRVLCLCALHAHVGTTAGIVDHTAVLDSPISHRYKQSVPILPLPHLSTHAAVWQAKRLSLSLDIVARGFCIHSCDYCIVSYGESMNAASLKSGVSLFKVKWIFKCLMGWF